MITLARLRESNLPKEFLDILPEDTCSVCGSPIEASEALTMLKCSNPMCPEHGVQRLVSLLADLDVKDMGESRCRKFMNAFGVYNPYVIFAYNPDEDGALFEGCSMEFSNHVFEQVDSKRDMLLSEYIKIGNLPGIRDIAQQVVKGYDTLADFYMDLSMGGVAFIQERLGIADDKVSIKAVQVFDTLMVFRPYLEQFIDNVGIINCTCS